MMNSPPNDSEQRKLFMIFLYKLMICDKLTLVCYFNNNIYVSLNYNLGILTYTVDSTPPQIF